MKSIFEPAVREEIIQRIQLLNPDSQPKWGKMNVHQMLKHCALCEEMYLGKKNYKRAFIGRIFGAMGLKRILRDEKPLGRNAPTSPHFIVKETAGDILEEKHQWIDLVRQYEAYPANDFVHWFFGKMTREQVGQFVYKHDDHHLRQFGV